jgi:acetyltransferase EpsM
MILYGAGGHAKDVFDCLQSQGLKLECIFDDDYKKETFLDLQIKHNYTGDIRKDQKLIVSIGDNKVRFELINNKVKHPLGIVTHRTSYVANGVHIGEGTVVLARAVLQPESQIGKNSIVNTGAIIEHDCIFSDFVHVGPGAVICGNVRIGEGAFIGANATILPGISIGKWATIGAGSVVLKDVDDKTMVVGNPARLISRGNEG